MSQLRTRRLGALSLGLFALAFTSTAKADTTTVFLQYEEQRLVAGDLDDAPNDISWTLDWFGLEEVTLPALTVEGGQDRDQLIAAIQQIVEFQWEAVDVEFVTQRPQSGDFLMVTMGGRGGDVNLGGAGGWGIVDCYDENKTGVAFVFSDSLREDDGSLSASKLAMVVSQEVAHTVGLEHLGDSESFIMYPRTSSGVMHTFSETCEAIVDPIEDPEHPEYCLDHPGCEEGFQNDLAHLIEYLGPAVPDGVDTEGTETDGDSDGGGTGGGDSDGDTGGTDGQTGGTDGGTSGESTSGGGDSDGATSGSEGGTSGSDGDSGESDGDDPLPEDGDDSGCECRATPGQGRLAWAIPLLLIAGARRRRSGR